MSFVMQDLETLGTVPGCVILSIGAVEFFPEEGRLGDTFYTVVNKQSCLDAFLFEQPDTVAWWNRQSDEARQVLEQAETGGEPLVAAMGAYAAWLAARGNQNKLRVYGNGADFDNPILASAAHAVRVKLPGPFGGRCYRTLKNLHELFGVGHEAPKLQRSGTYHNALDDAKSQALHLMDIVRHIKETVNG